MTSNPRKDRDSDVSNGHETWEYDSPNPEPFDFKEDNVDSYSESDFQSDDSKSFSDESDPYDDNAKIKMGKNEMLHPKHKKEITIGAPIICSAIAIGSFIQGGVIGGLFGLFQGLSEGASLGIIRQPGFAKQLGGVTTSSALSFGFWLGTYSGSKCGIAAIRGKHDLINSFGGGFIAGIITSMRSRSMPTILISGIGSGALMTFLDSFKL